MTDRSWRWTLFGLALLPRLATAGWLGNALHFEDEALYSDTALRLVTTFHFQPNYPREPGYPAFLALLAGVLPAGVVFLRFGQACVCAFGAVLTFELGNRLFGRAPGLAAAAIYALDPLLVVSGALLYPEAVSAVLVVLVLLCAVRTRRNDCLWSAGAAGFLLGLLSLFRPVAIAIVPPIALWATLGKGINRRVLLCGLALAISYSLALVPWMYRNYQVYGGLVPISASGRQNAFALVEPAIECRVETMSRVDHRDPFARARADIKRSGLTTSIVRRAWEQPSAFLAHLATHFTYFWELYPTRLMTDDPGQLAKMHDADRRLPVKPSFRAGLRDYASALSFGIELGLALIGLTLVVRQRPSEAFLLVLVLLCFSLGYAVFIGKLRYRIPVLPELFLFSGVAVSAVATLVRGRLLGASGAGWLAARTTDSPVRHSETGTSALHLKSRKRVPLPQGGSNEGFELDDA